MENVKIKLQGKEVELKIPSVYEILFKTGINVVKLSSGEMSEYDKVLVVIAKHNNLTLSELDIDDLTALMEVVNGFFSIGKSSQSGSGNTQNK